LLFICDFLRFSKRSVFEQFYFKSSKKKLKKIVVVVLLTYCYAKNSLSKDLKCDSYLIGASPSGFKKKIGVYFMVKNPHYANFHQYQRRSGWELLHFKWNTYSVSHKNCSRQQNFHDFSLTSTFNVFIGHLCINSIVVGLMAMTTQYLHFETLECQLSKIDSIYIIQTRLFIHATNLYIDDNYIFQ
jgi:hypothetical protein